MGREMKFKYQIIPFKRLSNSLIMLLKGAKSPIYTDGVMPIIMACIALNEIWRRVLFLSLNLKYKSVPCKWYCQCHSP